REMLPSGPPPRHEPDFNSSAPLTTQNRSRRMAGATTSPLQRVQMRRRCSRRGTVPVRGPSLHLRTSAVAIALSCYHMAKMMRDKRTPVLLALILSMGLVAMDTTIVATAVPQVVADLGGFTQIGWVFSVYLLAQTVTIPIYGKLADL